MNQPPRLADWLLSRVLPLGKRGESIRGDLREEYRAMCGGGRPLGLPNLWYWHQALRLTLRYLTEPSRTPALSTPRRSPMLHDLTSDLRSALRLFRRTPGTSSLIVVTLALAIGAATIGFAFADLALFRGLPVDDPSRVVSVFAADTHGAQSRGRVSGPDYLDYRDRSQTLERVSAFRQGRAALIVDGHSRTLTVSWATGDFFRAMGQPAVQGRTLANADDAPGAPPVAVLSHRYWQEELAGRPDAVGRSMQIGRANYTVVGVVTPAMEVGNLAEIDVWLPLQITAAGARDVRDLRFVARLRDGVTFASAAAELAAIGDALATQYPESNAGWRVRLVPISDLMGGDNFWVVIALFLFSIGLLIAIATANVSNLVMVRAVARQRELAVRAALGARSGRLVRQLVIEGLMLSTVAAALAVPAAWLGLQVIASLSPDPVFHQLVIDAHEFSFVAALALLCPLIFSVAPARTLARTDMRQVLAATGSRGSTAPMRGRDVLVVAQVALAVILLTASSLALRSVRQVFATPTGLDTSRVLVFTLDFNDAQYPAEEQSRAAALATREALSRVAGVDISTMLTALPILGAEGIAPITVDHDVPRLQRLLASSPIHARRRIEAGRDHHRGHRRRRGRPGPQDARRRLVGVERVECRRGERGRGEPLLWRRQRRDRPPPDVFPRAGLDHRPRCRRDQRRGRPRHDRGRAAARVGLDGRAAPARDLRPEVTGRSRRARERGASRRGGHRARRADRVSRDL
ncbi:MAG: ABC transporter permease [Vicinamibacterales bacterium]